MSKSISIKKNGTAQTLTVDKLRLPKQGGGTEDWLPADGKNLVKIVVKQNGTYNASDFGAYGISEVKVRCTLHGGSATSAAVEKIIKTLHNPCPAEGGLARVMSAHHLETPLSTTGSCQWVPEAEVSLGTKYINVDNRTYKAKDDGKYGWSQATVSGISITQDGDTITHTDGEGTTTYTLPHYIRVEHGPTKFTYLTGETIDITGMLVKAYNENGTIWSDEDHIGGVVGNSEVSIVPEVATLEYETSISELYPDGIIHGGGFLVNGADDAVKTVLDGGTAGAFFTESETSGRVIMLVASATAFEVDWYEVWGSDPTKRNEHIMGSTSYEYNGQTVYFFGVDTPKGSLLSIPANYGEFSVFNMGPAAWTMIYGVHSGIGTTNIRVRWPRPIDGEILEDSFTIFVTADNFGGAEGGGGQTSGGGAGRDN